MNISLPLLSTGSVPIFTRIFFIFCTFLHIQRLFHVMERTTLPLGDVGVGLVPDSQNSGGTESIIPGVLNINGFPC